MKPPRAGSYGQIIANFRVVRRMLQRHGPFEKKLTESRPKIFVKAALQEDGTPEIEIDYGPRKTLFIGLGPEDGPQD